MGRKSGRNRQEIFIGAKLFSESSENLRVILLETSARRNNPILLSELIGLVRPTCRKNADSGSPYILLLHHLVLTAGLFREQCLAERFLSTRAR
jgi:hypothetical protein